jgi:hypothetical protein
MFINHTDPTRDTLVSRQDRKVAIDGVMCLRLHMKQRSTGSLVDGLLRVAVNNHCD